MAKKEVAYVPITQVKENQVNAPTKIEEPQYPDKGVSYAGYSKTTLSGNQFILNPQTPWFYVLVRPSFIGIESHPLPYPEAGKKLYISSMQINTSISAVDVNSYIEILSEAPGVGNYTTLFKTALLRSETTNFYFSVPLVVSDSYNPNITPTGLTINISSGAATLNVTSINLQGWIE